MHVAILAAAVSAALSGSPWTRHVIDNTSRGADGVRLADVNGDGLPDIATGWEEGGRIRMYLNPGLKNARKPWPAVTVGQAASPEDAVFVDLDGDGAIDIVSSCEGRERSIFVHWAPRKKEDLLNAQSWRTEVLPAARGSMQWMFATPLQVDGRRGVDLVAGAKNLGAKLGWFESPANPRDLAAWRWHPVYDAGWIMSIMPIDMDGDGDADILVSDRKGPRSGVLWLENPSWTEHRVGGAGIEVMFLTTADLDGDGFVDVLTAAKPREILCHRRLDATGKSWKEFRIPIPETAGTAKAVRVADLNLDGRSDVIFSCEQAAGSRSGVMWLSYEDSVTSGRWKAHEISGPAGVKFDLIELLDLDGDGDLDVITCEETENLGVIWYENPAR